MHRVYTQFVEIQWKRADTSINVDNFQNIGNEILRTRLTVDLFFVNKQKV